MRFTLHGDTARGLAQAPDLRRVGVVAIVVCRQAGDGRALSHRMHGDSVDEVAGTGRDDDALGLHAMKVRQPCAQRRVVRVRVLGCMCLGQRIQRLRARSAGIAVGGEIVRGHAQRIRAAMYKTSHARSPSMSRAPSKP